MKLAIISKVLPACLACLALVSASLVLSGCNTTKGFGEDLSILGRSITNASDDVVNPPNHQKPAHH